MVYQLKYTHSVTYFIENESIDIFNKFCKVFTEKGNEIEQINRLGLSRKDVFQDVCLDFLLAEYSGLQYKEIKALFLTSLKNRTIDQYRKAVTLKAKKIQAVDNVYDLCDNLIEYAEDEQEEIVLEDVIKCLTRTERNYLYAYMNLDCKYLRLAKKKNCSKTTARIKVKKIIKKIIDNQ
ncbi:hypothetical protein [Flammeovirga sp. OC4]|uniref:hypothetical protein n=1 Tax=Flammeovirga sp. OC4 TaxID=1382345 RepID=UPI0005C54321|nr:hypothetical protein [Flammeovirga sp. OC4]